MEAVSPGVLSDVSANPVERIIPDPNLTSCPLILPKLTPLSMKPTALSDPVYFALVIEIFEELLTQLDY